MPYICAVLRPIFMAQHILLVQPLGQDRTKVSFLVYIWQEEKWGHGAGADLDKVEREGEAIVENVQKGIRSRFYQAGRYSAKREQGTHHFHRLVAKFMATSGAV